MTKHNNISEFMLCIWWIYQSKREFQFECASPHNVPRYHQLMPIGCHFHLLYAALYQVVDTDYTRPFLSHSKIVTLKWIETGTSVNQLTGNTEQQTSRVASFFISLTAKSTKQLQRPLSSLQSSHRLITISHVLITTTSQQPTEQPPCYNNKVMFL